MGTLDGHAPIDARGNSLLNFSRGKLHRRTKVGSLRAQGEVVTFLELTEAGVRSLSPGWHTLVVEVQNPGAVQTFRVKLATASEGGAHASVSTLVFAFRFPRHEPICGL